MAVFGRLKNQVEEAGNDWDAYIAAGLLWARDKLIAGTEPFWWSFFDVALIEHEGMCGTRESITEESDVGFWDEMLTETILLKMSNEMKRSLSSGLLKQIESGFLTPKDAEDAKGAAWHCAVDAVDERMAEAHMRPLDFFLSIGAYATDLSEARNEMVLKNPDGLAAEMKKLADKRAEDAAVLDNLSETYADEEVLDEPTIGDFVKEEAARIHAVVSKKVPDRKRSDSKTKKNKPGQGRPSTRPTGENAIRAMRTRLAMEGLRNFGYNDKEIGEAFVPPISRTTVSNIVNDNGKSTLAGTEQERLIVLAMAERKLKGLQELIAELNSTGTPVERAVAEEVVEEPDEILEGEVLDEEILDEEILEDE
jgi:uncharacterized protein (DUF169 family)